MVGKELHEAKHNSPLPSEAVCLTAPRSRAAALFQHKPRSMPASMPQVTSIVASGSFGGHHLSPAQRIWTAPDLL